MDDESESVEASEPIWHDWRQTCRRRTRYLLVALGVWTALVAWRLVDVMVVERDTYVAAFRQMSRVEGTVPAARGRLLDEQGLPLAWSERYFRLVYEPPADGGGVDADLAAMGEYLSIDERAIMDRIYHRPGRDVLVVDDLPVTLVERTKELVNSNDRWTVRTGFRRRYATADTRIRQAIGETRVYGQKEVGISGWELEYDRQLRGVDGKYEVMVDHRGRWLPSTWRELRPQQPGADVFVPVRLQPPQ